MAVHPDTMLIVAEARRLETLAEGARASLAEAVVSAGPHETPDQERMRWLLRALWPPALPLAPSSLRLGALAGPRRAAGGETEALAPRGS